MPTSTVFERDWGAPLPSSSSSASDLTHCVRRFGVPSPTTPWKGDITNQIVACKFSPSSTDLLVSYSERGVYLFDVEGKTYKRPEKPTSLGAPVLSGSLSDEELDAEMEGEEDGATDTLSVNDESTAGSSSTSTHSPRNSSVDDTVATAPAARAAASTLFERTAASLAAVLAEEEDEEEEGSSEEGEREDEAIFVESDDEDEEAESDDPMLDDGDQEELEEEESEEEDDDDEGIDYIPGARTRLYHPDVPMVAPHRHYTGHANSEVRRSVSPSLPLFELTSFIRPRPSRTSTSPPEALSLLAEATMEISSSGIPRRLR
jgi:hypothetical protein